MSSLVEAVAASVASILVAVIILMVLLRIIQVKWGSTNNSQSFRREEMGMTREELKHLGKNIKGVVVEEGGIDVLYMRKLENGRLTDVFTTVLMNPSFEQEDDDGHEDKVDEDGPIMAEPTSAPATLLPSSGHLFQSQH